jgi:hypothetical protein
MAVDFLCVKARLMKTLISLSIVGLILMIIGYQTKFYFLSGIGVGFVLVLGIILLSSTDNSQKYTNSKKPNAQKW